MAICFFLPGPPSQPMTDTSTQRLIARTAILAGIMFVLTPLFEVGTTAWPIRTGDAQWRFAVLGLLSQGASVAVFGLMLLVVGAAMSGKLGLQRVLSGLCAIAAVAFLLTTVAFALDALQVRSTVRPESLTMFTMTMAKAVLVMAAGSVVCIILTVFSWRAGKAPETTSLRSAPLVGMRPERGVSK